MTGVQTCALPISLGLVDRNAFAERRGRSILIEDKIEPARCRTFDRMRIAGGNPKRRMGCLSRGRLDHDVLEMPQDSRHQSNSKDSAVRGWMPPRKKKTEQRSHDRVIMAYNFFRRAALIRHGAAASDSTALVATATH